METNKNVEHKFDLSGCEAGDTFLGCSVCHWQLPPDQATKPECSVCGNRLSLYSVTPSDVPPQFQSCVNNGGSI